MVEYREKIPGDLDWKDNERQKRGTEMDAQQCDETLQSTCWRKTNQPTKKTQQPQISFFPSSWKFVWETGILSGGTTVFMCVLVEIQVENKKENQFL